MLITFLLFNTAYSDSYLKIVDTIPIKSIGIDNISIVNNTFMVTDQSGNSLFFNANGQTTKAPIVISKGMSGILFDNRNREYLGIYPDGRIFNMNQSKEMYTYFADIDIKETMQMDNQTFRFLAGTKDNLYSILYNRNKPSWSSMIIKIDSAGKKRFRFLEGEPAGLCFHKGNLLYLTKKGILIEYDGESSKPVNRYQLPKGINQTSGLAVDSSGFLYTFDSNLGAILKIRS